ncbi:MAG: AAA family ATPase [Actinomycetota bacterium]
MVAEEPPAAHATEQRALLDAVTSVARSGSPAHVVVVGDAGIGKSTLLGRAIQVAESQGVRVLSSRPAELESDLPLAGLIDLLSSTAELVVPWLAPLPAVALEVALRRRDAGDRAPDSLTLSLAVLEALRVLARLGPTVLVVDDVQWLDAPTAHVLAFALRRVESSQLAVLTASRPRPPSASAALLEALPEPVRRFRLAALAEAELRQVIALHLPATVSGADVHRIHELSGGNPFYALQIAREPGVLHREPGEPHSVPTSLQELLRSRLTRLAPATRSVLATAAAAGAASLDVLRRIESDVDAALGEAEEHGIAAEVAGQVAFTHPLLSAAAYDLLTEGQRRQLHGRLAESVADPVERARHRARAATGPDHQLAADLEEAARVTAGRGAPAAAADLAELACGATPPEDVGDIWRRLVLTADFAAISTDEPRAEEIGRRLLKLARTPGERAEAMFIVAMYGPASAPAACAQLEEALEFTAVGSRLRSQLLAEIAWFSFVVDPARTAELTERAAAEAAAAGHDDMLLMALTGIALWQVSNGATDGHAAIRRGLVLEAAGARSVAPYRSPLWARGVYELAHDDIDGARADFEELLSRAEESGNSSSVRGLNGDLTEVETRAGRLDAAGAAADRCLDLARAQGSKGGGHSYVAAFAAAARGEVERAARLAAKGLELAIGDGDLFYVAHCARVLAELALVQRDLSTAVHRAREARQAVRTLRHEDPCWCPWEVTGVEAMLAHGDADEAAEVALEARWQSQQTGCAQRSRTADHLEGLILVSRGEFVEGLDLLRAVAAAVPLQTPYDKARALLSLGVAERRARHKAAARTALYEAHRLLDRIGARAWADYVLSELSRAGGAPTGSPTGSQESEPVGAHISTTERRVIDLVTAGHTNKEDAANLFVSVKTVEANLSSIFRKLGVRSRTELAARARAN